MYGALRWGRVLRLVRLVIVGSHLWVWSRVRYVLSCDMWRSQCIERARWFAGELYSDTVTLGDLVIESQGIGNALLAFGFDGVDGILG